MNWLIANSVGEARTAAAEPGQRAWTDTLILAIALDLGAAHARPGKTKR